MLLFKSSDVNKKIIEKYAWKKQSNLAERNNILKLLIWLKNIYLISNF